MRRAAEQGFTLLEVLVALGVFSLAAVALINLAGQNTRSAGIVEARTLAAVVAENRAVEAIAAPGLPAGAASGTETQAGRVWAWTRSVVATDDPAIQRVDIAVREPAAGRQVLSALTVFRAAP